MNALPALIATSSLLLQSAPVPTVARTGADTQLKDPLVAAEMTAGIPLGIAAAGLTCSFAAPISPFTAPAFGLAVAAPVTLGYGYEYAGDAERGRLATMGWPVAAGLVAVAASVAFGKATDVDPGSVAFPPWFVSGLVGFGVGSVLYVVWAAWDAYQTAERHNADISREGSTKNGLTSPGSK